MEGEEHTDHQGIKKDNQTRPSPDQRRFFCVKLSLRAQVIQRPVI